MRSLLWFLMVCLFGSPVAGAAQGAATPSASPAAPGAIQDPAIYCEQQGGVVRERVPVLGTNDPASQIQLAGSRRFCEFTGGAGADPATSWIAIDLDTLMAVTPTLAALAYLTRPPLPTHTTPGANPASLYCAHLGGSELGSASGVGGGWVTEDTDTGIQVLQACAFPDGSIIDSWGIAYHADGTIRGADLASILQYQPASPPLVFPSQ